MMVLICPFYYTYEAIFLVMHNRKIKSKQFDKNNLWIMKIIQYNLNTNM